MNKFLLAISFFFILFSFSAQQNVFNNSSLFNYYSLNSAYAGSKNTKSIGLSIQKQWTGIEGSPFSQYVSYHNSFENKKLGYGLILDNDQIGVHRRTSIQATFAYHNPLNKGVLSFGLDLNADQYNYKLNELTLYEPDNSIFTSENLNQLRPDAGFSILYQTNKSIFGLKASNLIQNEFSFNSNFQLLQEKMSFDLLLGKAFYLNKSTVIKPYFLANYITSGQYFYDLSLNFTFDNKLTFGASYRNDKNINLLGHFFVSDQLRIGYSYELSLTRLTKNKPNSFEIFLGLNISKDKGEIVSPRFYSL